MRTNSNRQSSEYTLLGNGASGQWEIAVIESPTADELLMEIEGPNTSLVFKLRNLSVLEKTCRFLQDASRQAGKRNGESKGNLTLGKFGVAGVSLVWDDENGPRSFLIVRGRQHVSFRVCLNSADMQDLAKSFVQLLKDLPSPVVK